MSMPFYYNDTLYCDSLIVKFSYDIYICDDSVMIFDNFSVIAFWGCDNLDYLLAYLQNIGDYDEIVRIIDMIEFQASLIFEQEYIKGKLQALGWQCPKSFIESHFYRLTCYQTCLEFNTKSGKQVIGNIEKYPCGRKCCKRIRTHCMEGNIVVSSDPEYEQVGSGVCDLQPNVGCLGILIGECERICGEP
jgi:hypothetical protein